MIEKHIDWDNAVDQSAVATEAASLVDHLRRRPELTAERRSAPRVEPKQRFVDRDTNALSSRD
jgi:hypothetical protein